MAGKKEISEAVIRRLPKYCRHLRDLEQAGVMRISSSELGARMGLTSSQIRQDLNCFGGFGQQGYGYHVPTLSEAVGRILGLDKRYNMVVVGAGNIGQALTGYTRFQSEGFVLRGLFDVDPNLVGSAIKGMTVQHVDELPAFAEHTDIDVGVIATPRAAAQQTADLLLACGARSICNFAPVDVKCGDVPVENIHLSDALQMLSYHLGGGAARVEQDR